MAPGEVTVIDPEYTPASNPVVTTLTLEVLVAVPEVGLTNIQD
jgi:hypothetical protein